MYQPNLHTQYVLSIKCISGGGHVFTQFRLRNKATPCNVDELRKSSAMNVEGEGKIIDVKFIKGHERFIHNVYIFAEISQITT